MSKNTGLQDFMQFSINQTDLLAGTAQDLVAPADGYFEGMQTGVQVAVTTGGPLQVAINGSNVTNLLNTVANGATKGTRYNYSFPASYQGPVAGAAGSRQFKKGDRITITPSSFATAGAVNGNLQWRASAAPDV